MEFSRGCHSVFPESKIEPWGRCQGVRTGWSAFWGLVAVSFVGRKHHNAVWLFSCHCGSEHGASMFRRYRRIRFALVRPFARRDRGSCRPTSLTTAGSIDWPRRECGLYRGGSGGRCLGRGVRMVENRRAPRGDGKTQLIERFEIRRPMRLAHEIQNALKKPQALRSCSRRPCSYRLWRSSSSLAW